MGLSGQIPIFVSSIGTTTANTNSTDYKTNDRMTDGDKNRDTDNYYLLAPILLTTITSDYTNTNYNVNLKECLIRS
jgi:hypothetical protein